MMAKVMFCNFSSKCFFSTTFIMRSLLIAFYYMEFFATHHAKQCTYYYENNILYWYKLFISTANSCTVDTELGPGGGGFVSDSNDPALDLLQTSFSLGTWFGVIFTAVGLSLVFFWALNPHSSFLFSLISFELVFISIAVEMVYFSQSACHSGAFIFALFLLTLAALESAIGLAYIVFFSRGVKYVGHFF